MHRIVASVTRLAQHLTLLVVDPERFRPAACPHCGIARPCRHGYYYRKAVHGRAPDSACARVPIPRFRCAGCKRTCSRLPACIAPRRWYDWLMQQVMLLRLSTGEPLAAACAYGKIDRHTVRRWRDWLGLRGEIFAFSLRSRFPEWGRVADTPAFWCRCLAERSLQELMAWLDLDLAVP
jgi:transposase-like protein